MKKSKEEELREQKLQEREAADAYERWLYRKVCRERVRVAYNESARPLRLIVTSLNRVNL